MRSAVLAIPPEILEAILFLIRDDPASLRASSLVSFAWKDVSQHLLFGNQLLRLSRLTRLNDAELSDVQPVLSRFRRLVIGLLAFVGGVTMTGDVEDHVHEQTIMFGPLFPSNAHGFALPWMPLSFQFISSVVFDSTVSFATYITLRDFLAGLTNLEHLVFGERHFGGMLAVIEQSHPPPWTGFRLRSLECCTQSLKSELVHTLLSWLAASDSPRLESLCVGLRAPISGACYVRDALRTLLISVERTLLKLEVHVESCDGASGCIVEEGTLLLISFCAGHELRLSTWLLPGCSLETLHLFVGFADLHTVIDSATLPYLRQLKVTSVVRCSERSASSEDLLGRMTLPLLDRVSVILLWDDCEDKEAWLRPFAGAQERQILEVVMRREIPRGPACCWDAGGMRR
jgi:hypothetical protein